MATNEVSAIGTHLQVSKGLLVVKSQNVGLFYLRL